MNINYRKKVKSNILNLIKIKTKLFYYRFLIGTSLDLFFEKEEQKAFEFEHNVVSYFADEIRPTKASRIVRFLATFLIAVQFLVVSGLL